jgi:APA family basic amino acid/polyamine antiporter
VNCWWFPLAPIIFLAGSGVLAAMLLMHSPWPSLLGAAVVLAGLPVRWLLLRGKQIAPSMTAETELS